MKHPLVWLTLLVFLLLAPLSGYAAPNSILLVFNGNTEVNRHTYSYIAQVLGSSGGYKVSATLDPSSVKPGMYKAVIVVSTKTTSGIDPSLAAFVKAYPAPKELFLVSLLSRTGSLTVSPMAKANSDLGVDGVTAATTWSRGSQAMHGQWMQILVDAMASR